MLFHISIISSYVVTYICEFVTANYVHSHAHTHIYIYIYIYNKLVSYYIIKVLNLYGKCRVGRLYSQWIILVFGIK